MKKILDILRLSPFWYRLNKKEKLECIQHFREVFS
jgi:hypothetical protein